jgi:hypothetical protein
VLLHQEYSSTDDYLHIQVLITYFKDSRYITVGGKPVFIIYRPHLFPDIKSTIFLWREEVKKAGFPDLYIGYAETKEYEKDVKVDGFDFSFQFQPNYAKRPSTYKDSSLKRYWRAFLKRCALPANDPYQFIYDYEEFVDLQIESGFKPNSFPCITPMWDNSARRKVFYFILHNSTPDKYKKWLTHILSQYPWKEMPESFLFINAWNEWAEGNHLEPCQKWGTAYLQATKDSLAKFDVNGKHD